MTKPRKQDDPNANEVDALGLVRLEVDMIESRQVTKIIEVSKETADKLINKLWLNETRPGWSEEECCAFIMRKDGQVTRESVWFECETIDILEPNSKSEMTDMITNDPNNTPDSTVNGGRLRRLVRPRSRYVADQAREMGLKVGDVIVGREGGGDPETGWWQEQRLTLLYLGTQCCVWRSEGRNNALSNFRDEGEAANWSLTCRDWYRCGPNAKADPRHD